MKKFQAGLLLILLFALPLGLAGCRTRTIANPELADTVVQTEQPHQEPEEPEVPPEPEEPPEQEPMQEEPPQEEAPTVEEPTSEPAEHSKPQTVSSKSQTGAALLQEQTAFDITVTYDSNGGDTGAVSTVVSTGGSYGVQPEAVRRGFAFGGWFTAPEGGAQVLPDTAVTQTENHTLYAHWQDKPTCSVTFDGNGGRVKAKEARLELSDGDVYGALPTPLYEGYDFVGWFTAPEGGEPIGEESVFTGAEDRVLYARWSYNPFEFWSFTLRNKAQQVYMCQQVSIYIELEDNVTQQACQLITATGSQNIAENRGDPNTTDEWVQQKKPQVVVKATGSMANAEAVRQAVAARFPDQQVFVVSSAALGGDAAAALYAQLALSKQLYGDWYTDVDLATAASELGVNGIILYP